ncbi:hypothetical protein L356_05810 [Enterobacter sp. MGH 10]|nr:hypothetical protein L356_05810 [Enterobacter sp. MGH 10]
MQYCTNDLKQCSLHISVSDVPSPCQNGDVESSFGRFKQKLDDLNRIETAGEMSEAVYRHIHYDNHRRTHSPLCCPNLLRHLSSQISDLTQTHAKHTRLKLTL